MAARVRLGRSDLPLFRSFLALDSSPGIPKSCGVGGRFFRFPLRSPSSCPN